MKRSSIQKVAVLLCMLGLGHLTECWSGPIWGVQSGKRENGDPQTGADPAPTRVSFCRFPSMLSALSHIAEQKDFFALEGLDVQFENVMNGKICQDELIAGKTQFINVASGPFSYIAGQKPPLKILAVLQEGPGVSVYARKDSGIDNFTALRKHRVAYLPGTVSGLFMYAMLDKFSLAQTDLSLSPMQPPAMVSALTSGLIDACAVWEPWGSSVLRQLGDKGIKLPGRGIYSFQSFLVTSDEAIASGQNTIEPMLRALLRAERFVLASPAESMDILSRAVSFERGSLEAVWDEFHNRVFLDETALAGLEGNFLLLKKYAAGDVEGSSPDFGALFAPQFLVSAAPDRVSPAFLSKARP